MAVTGITRMNIAGMANETLILLRDALTTADSDRGLIVEYLLAIEAEIEHRSSRDVCDKCHQPVHQVTGTSNGEPWESWHHDSVADDVFCGLVMRAADRLPR